MYNLFFAILGSYGRYSHEYVNGSLSGETSLYGKERAVRILLKCIEKINRHFPFSIYLKL